MSIGRQNIPYSGGLFVSKICEVAQKVYMNANVQTGTVKCFHAYL
jgi:hypothetical protein